MRVRDGHESHGQLLGKSSIKNKMVFSAIEEKLQIWVQLEEQLIGYFD